MKNWKWYTAVVSVLSLLLLGPLQPARADLSGFVGSVGFDEDANLNRGLGFGIRWGRSSGFIGGETALMIALPEREFEIGDNNETSQETATAIFYEGRFLVNIPAGQVSPFVGVGFGQIIVTSTDVPTSIGEVERDALKEVSKLQTSNAFSYGGGIRYGLNERLDLRADLRQYIVFSVSGLAKQKAAERLGENLGVDLPVEDSTVQYNELSVGLNFRF